MWSTWGSGFGFRVQALRRGHALQVVGDLIAFLNEYSDPAAAQ